MNVFVNLAINHLLSIVEHQLIDAAPQIVTEIEKDIALLFTKLNTLIKTKPEASHNSK
jgi:hypothetical protein